MSQLEIIPIPLLRDNYGYLIHDPASVTTGIVDPSEASPVLAALETRGWRLDYVLNTHHHHDHVGGNGELKRATGCRIVASAADVERIEGVDVAVEEGKDFHFGSTVARILSIPGHTRGHVAYWFEHDRAVFVGDTLFSLGCGRLFEGTPGQMWESLGKLKALPADTRVYCGHEYTQANAAFALTVEPDNSDLRSRSEQVDDLRERGLPTVPSLIGEERKANPFLRADDPDVRERLKLQTSGPVKVFAELRRRKDEF